jgi:hypothetical protein
MPQPLVRGEARSLWQSLSGAGRLSERWLCDADTQISLVETRCLGPVGRAATERRFFHLATVFRVDPVALRQGPQALLSSYWLDGSRLSRRDATAKNLAHSASLHPGENNAPSKPGTKDLSHPNEKASLGIFA